MCNEEDKDKKFAEHLKHLISSGLTEAVEEVLSALTAREAKILRIRFGIDLDKNHGLDEVGKQFDISRQRIREIEEKALRKLRNRGPDDDGPDAA